MNSNIFDLCTFDHRDEGVALQPRFHRHSKIQNFKGRHSSNGIAFCLFLSRLSKNKLATVMWKRAWIFVHDFTDSFSKSAQGQFYSIETSHMSACICIFDFKKTKFFNSMVMCICLFHPTLKHKESTLVVLCGCKTLNYFIIVWCSWI